MPKATLPLTHLGDVSIDEFYRHYWQKKPLFVRQAFTDLSQREPDLLAGYALEPDIETRLIIETPANAAFSSDWQVSHGPLAEDAFEQLPQSHWTLLVQAVDQLDPGFLELLHKFRFVPNWRIDDIMVSYAVDQGSVGPHFDHYDVFLLQAHGRRRWHIGQECSQASPLQQDCDLKLLTEFKTQATYEVEPGDLLYIPPQIAHWGVALNECITYSIGYRAPSVGDAITDFSEYVASNLSNHHRYTDAEMGPRKYSGEITPDDIKRIQSLLANSLNDKHGVSDWFARYMTTAKREGPAFEPEHTSTQRQLSAGSRAAFYQTSPTAANLYINGDQYKTSLSFARRISAYQLVDTETLSETEAKLVAELYELGHMN